MIRKMEKTGLELEMKRRSWRGWHGWLHGTCTLKCAPSQVVAEAEVARSSAVFLWGGNYHFAAQLGHIVLSKQTYYSI